jgi:hypothetical protein
MKIKKWLRAGDENQLADAESTEEVLELAGQELDAACSEQILGECLFVGKNGKTYVGTVEFVITEANPEYVKDILEQIEENDE